MLTAVGMDPNDCIYPLAMAVVEVESKSTWKWFLQTLKNDLGIENTYAYTIMTDKQKGLIPAVRDQFPDSEHRFCVRHLYSNFQVCHKGEALKNMLWAIARSSTVTQWTENMERMKALSVDAYEYLEELAPNTWVRAFFGDFCKCDILLNNNSEVFNKYILDARELPILSMMERIKSQLMTRIYSKQKEMQKWQGDICPKIMKKLQRNAEMANICYVLPAGMGIFQVQERDSQYIVDLNAKQCDCRRWNLTGIPCNHAVSCFRHERLAPEDMVHSCYSIERYTRAYGHNIMPCRDHKSWQKMNGVEVKPPVYEKKVGRPRKCRRKQPHEVQGKLGARMSKHGVIMHCRHCGSSTHNVRGCDLKKAGKRPKMQVKRKDKAMLEEEIEEDPVITQAVLPPLPPDEHMSSQLSSTMLSQLLTESTPSLRQTQEAGPIPECAFIAENVPTTRPIALTTARTAGRAKMRKHKKTIEAKEATGKK